LLAFLIPGGIALTIFVWQ
jgi:hypothetical protein